MQTTQPTRPWWIFVVLMHDYLSSQPVVIIFPYRGRKETRKPIRWQADSSLDCTIDGHETSIISCNIILFFTFSTWPRLLNFYNIMQNNSLSFWLIQPSPYFWRVNICEQNKRGSHVYNKLKLQEWPELRTIIFQFLTSHNHSAPSVSCTNVAFRMNVGVLIQFGKLEKEWP